MYDLATRAWANLIVSWDQCAVWIHLALWECTDTHTDAHTSQQKQRKRGRDVDVEIWSIFSYSWLSHTLSLPLTLPLRS